MTIPQGSSPVTVVDVARAAGVSTATAARALGDYGTVRESTREKVRRAAAELGYRANDIARSMITGRTGTIGVVLADIDNPFFAKLTRGIADRAKQSGYEIVLANSDEELESERAAVQLLTRKRVDGLIVAPASRDDADHLRDAIASGIQLVLADRQVDDLPVDTVTLRNAAGARDAVSRLIDLGHRRIGYVSGALRSADQRISSGQQRIQGYRRALKDAGVPLRADLIRIGGPKREDAARETAALLALADRPTAIVAADSLISLGVLEELKRQHVAQPQDMSVVGFDDADWATVVTPSLSVIAQPAYDLGTRAAEMLIERINGSTSASRIERLRSEFIERASISRAPTTEPR